LKKNEIVIRYPPRKKKFIIAIGIILGILLYPVGVIALAGGIIFGIGFMIF